MSRNLLFKNQGMLSPYKKQVKSQIYTKGIATNPKSMAGGFKKMSEDERQIQQDVQIDYLLEDRNKYQDYNQESQENLKDFQDVQDEKQNQNYEETNLCQCQNCIKQQFPAGFRTDMEYNKNYKSYTTYRNSQGRKEPCARKLKYQKAKQSSIKSNTYKRYDKFQKQQIQSIPKRGAFKFSSTYLYPPQKAECKCLSFDQEKVEEQQQQNQTEKDIQIASSTAFIPIEAQDQNQNQNQMLNEVKQNLMQAENNQQMDEVSKFYEIRKNNLSSKIKEVKQILYQLKSQPDRQYQQQENEVQYRQELSPKQQQYIQSNRYSVESAKTQKFQNSHMNQHPNYSNRKEKSMDRFQNAAQQIQTSLENEVDEISLEKIQQAAKQISSIGGGKLQIQKYRNKQINQKKVLQEQKMSQKIV